MRSSAAPGSSPPPPSLAARTRGPALTRAGLPADAVQLLRVPGRESAEALVGEPDRIPLVILRGSGESTRSLAARAALAGVRTLAHADGGGVLYLDASASEAEVRRIVADINARIVEVNSRAVAGPPRTGARGAAVRKSRRCGAGGASRRPRGCRCRP